MKSKFKFWKVLKIAVAIVFFVFAFGGLTMLLWNWLVPSLFHGPIITFCEAIGLLLLSKLFFGGFKGRGGHCCGGRNKMRDHWKRKMENRMASMTDEEKEKFRNRCMHKF